MIFIIYRVESSTPNPNVYVQSKPVAPQGNRNYYNTTNQGYNNPTQYDSYYSVYDDDVELYRDVGKLFHKAIY